MVSVASSSPHAVQAIAVERDGHVEVWTANLTGAAVTVCLDRPMGNAAVLDDGSFVPATLDPNALAHLARPLVDGRLTLGPHAVARVRLGRS